MKAFLFKVTRAMSVSVFTTALSAALLVALTAFVGLAAALANVIATVAGIVPSYELNRRWVWKRRGPSSAGREVIPFWALSIAGLVLSTIAVAHVAALGAGWSHPVRTVALPIANLSVFGLLWIVQFLLLDRVLFKHRPDAVTTPEELPV